jgi:thioredoxin 1
MQRIILSLFLVWLVSLPACTKNEGAAKTDAPDARIVVTTASYDRLLKESTKPIVLDFWASWCGPCRMMDPIFAQASAERPDIVFGKVNVDEEPKLAQKHNIQAIPTLLVIVDGKVVKRSVGVLKKEALLRLLDEAVKNARQSQAVTGYRYFSRRDPVAAGDAGDETSMPERVKLPGHNHV